MIFQHFPHTNVFGRKFDLVIKKVKGQTTTIIWTKLVDLVSPTLYTKIIKAILKFFKRHLLPKRKSDWAKTWWEASQWHKDSELLKSFRSDIQDGRHGGHLEILQTTFPPKPYVGSSWNLVGGITVRQKFKIAKITPLRCPRWPPGHLEILQTTPFPNRKSDWAKTWREASQWRKDTELLKSFLSDIQDGCHLEILQTTSPHKP